MNQRGHAAAVCAALAAVVWAAAGAQDGGTRPGREPLERLARLDPANPMAYLELAEELADSAVTERQRALARELFALAGVLDRARLGRSACLALADLSEDQLQRRRLLALAWLLDERGGGAAPVPGGPREFGRDAAVAVAEAMSHYRMGEGTQALTALDKTPGARDALEACGHAFRGGAARFLADCEVYRGGRQRPSLSRADLVTMLRLETAILSGADRSWSAELLLGRGEPLVEVDPDRLAEILGADPTRPFHRDGRWVEKR